VVVAFVAFMIQAQNYYGQWKIHPYLVGDIATNCIDAGDKVYYLSAGSLYVFDKAQNSNEALNRNGILNDDNITQIYYNYDNKYLVITYSNCNIDIIKNDGSVVNLPDLKDLVINRNRNKTINDITFSGGDAFVATSFGYIVIDGNSFNFNEARNYDAKINSVAIVGDVKIMSIGSMFYYSQKDAKVEKVWLHKTFTHEMGDGRIYPINGNKFFFVNGTSLHVLTFETAADGTCTFVTQDVADAVPVTLQPIPSGFVASFFSNNFYYTFDKNGDNATKLTGNELYTSQENGNWWVFGANGLAHVVNGVKGDYHMANGISISANAYWSTYDASQQRILLCRTTDNLVLPTANENAKTEINSYDGTTWRNITPEGAPSNEGNYWIVVSPNEPNTYFYSCRTIGGVCKVQNDKVVARYVTTNSPIINRAVALRFDSKGNLWMPQNRSQVNIDAFAITPQNQLLTVVDSSKFVISDMGGLLFEGKSAGFKRICFDIGAGDTKAYSTGNYDSPLVFWTSNDDLTVKQYKSFSSFNDQDNKPYSDHNWVYIKADKDSMIWVGTTNGVFSLNPLKVFDDDFSINLIDVVKDEGQPSSGKLLEGIQVNCIEVDAMNRKWLATNSSGVYLVSADGSEILKHFDMSNSALPSDQIYSVCCNPNTASVLIVTASGVVEYFGDDAPSASDYSNAYAYPNPVQPDFTGYITIKGLKKNSNVVITDASGNQVYTATTPTGIVLWDGCDSAGNRLSTGRYKVYASQGSPNLGGDPIMRIVIIK